MPSHLSHSTIVAIAIILGGLLSVVACDSSSRRAAMLAVLDEADSLNRNYIPITSDSLLLEATSYFDSHGTPNERLRAHYLLGCAYRDMKEAPRAIEAWLDATACADTTAADCDYSVLARVYAHLAMVYHQQLLFNYELEAHRHASYYEHLAGNTLYAIYEYKMCANAYLLQNKVDSTEAILLDAIKRYREHGYDQEALQTSVPLMHLYANMPGRLPELKQLVEHYDAECNLFDGTHELPPDKRLFYYYKGRCLEESMQLDSAEYYYRKVYRPNISYVTLNSMYKGLLNVFTKRHQTDSIAKYAYLYCAVNDSSIAIKDQELTANMSASYSYNRYQHEAFNNAEEAHAANLRFIIATTFLIILMITVVYFLRRNKKRREEQSAKYRAAIVERNKLRHEIESLNAKDHETLIDRKEQEIAVLNHTIEQLSTIYQRVTASDRLSDFEKSGIVQVLHKKRIYHKGQEAVSNSEWDMLTSQFHQDMPSASSAMSSLSPLQLQVCILLLLGFEEGEIAIMRQTRPQVISNAKARANQKLFMSNDSASLKDNLMGMVAS